MSQDNYELEKCIKNFMKGYLFQCKVNDRNFVFGNVVNPEKEERGRVQRVRGR